MHDQEKTLIAIRIMKIESNFIFVPNRDTICIYLTWKPISVPTVWQACKDNQLTIRNHQENEHCQI